MAKVISLLALGLVAAAQDTCDAQCGGGGAEGTPGEGDDVVTLDDANFNEYVTGSKDLWLVEFYAPWCGHCKTLAPNFAKAATELRGKARLGVVDATAEQGLRSRFDVESFPKLVYFPYGDKEEDSTGKEFDGQRNKDAIVDWALDELTKVGVDVNSVEQLTGANALDQCLTKRYCAVAVLPHIIEGGKEARERFLGAVREVAKDAPRKLVNFAWLEGGAQPEFESTFRLEAGYPTFVIINAPKGWAVTHVGAFEGAALSLTMRKAMTGNLATQPYDSMPELDDTAAWDGEDYTPPEEDEDY